jgi:hypothetical protein
MSPRFALAIAATLLIPALAGPSSAGAAVVFGSDLDPQFPPIPAASAVSCDPDPSVTCTDVALSFHEGNDHPAQAPISGVVTLVRYRSNTADEATLRLARLDGNGQAIGVGTGPKVRLNHSGAITDVPVQPGLPIQQGDYLAGDGSRTTAWNCSNTGGSLDVYLPVLGNGPPSRPPDGSRTDCEVLIQGTIEPDADADRLGDESQDNCTGVSNPDGLNTDGDAQGDACDLDDDNDGFADTADNCPTVSNPDQENTDGAPQGNACDPDDDNDGDPDVRDNCPLTRNPSQADADGDGLGDACDLTVDPVPTPELGSVVVASVVSGTVTIALPPGSARAAGAGASQKGLTFIPLQEARAIPVGSFLNTRRGTAQIISATNTAGGTQSGKFSRGLFQVLQSRARRARGLTELRLKGSSFRSCRTGRSGRSGSAGAAQVSRRTIRRLRSNAKGRFRTRGRHSAATVRGTVWITADRCDGTLTKVRRGRVAVRDFRRKRTILVRAGKSYLARAPR